MDRNIKQEFYEKLMNQGICKINSVPLPYNINHFSTYVECPYYNTSDTSFAIQYLRSKLYLENLRTQPLMVSNLPVAYFSENELWMLLKQNVYSILTFPVGEISEEMYVYAIGKDPMLFAFLGTKYQNIEIVKYIVNYEPLMLEYVHDDLRYYWLCEAAVSRNWQAIKHVPTGDVLDEGIIEKALTHKDAFILDIVPSSFLNQDIYARHFKTHPKKSIDAIVSALLNIRDVELLINLMETTENFAVERLFKEVNPKILCSNDREDALLKLFALRPNWIHYIDAVAITPRIFEQSIANNELVALTPLTWSADMIKTAYNTNRKAFINIPVSRMGNIGEDRMFQILLSAIEEGWISELPAHFFSATLLDNENSHALLMEHRPQYSAVVANSDDFDFDLLNKFDFSVDELLRVSVKANELSDELLDHNIANFVLLNDSDKTMERSIKFLQTYPHHHAQIPQKYFDNKDNALTIIEGAPMVCRYLPTDQVFEIFKKF